MKKQIKVLDLETLAQAASHFLELTKGYRIFALYAPMGTGKTTFVRAVAEQLGAVDSISSPTFSIINEYSLGDETNRIFHFDCYRLEELEEAIQLGFEDYFYDENSLCFVEWPELIEPILPPETLAVSIEQEPDGSRIISFELPS